MLTLFLNFKNPARKLAVPVAGLLLLAGCQSVSLKDLTPWTKSSPLAYKPTNTFSVDFLPADFSRVAVLPVSHNQDAENQLSFLTRTFLSELNGKANLEAIAVDSKTLNQLTGKSQWNSTDSLPPELLLRIRDQYRADGVLFTDLTHYYPYKPISVGIRCKMADAVTGEILWSADTVYNAGNQKVQDAALDFQRKKSGSPFPLKDSGSILQSPLYFSRFVASSMLDTLPRR